MSRKLLLGHLCAFFTIFIWGTTFISTKVLLQNFNPIEILFYRFIIGYVFLWLIRPKTLHTGSFKMEFQFMMAGLMGICLNYLFENMALLYTGAAIVSVIVSASPFMIGFLAYIFLKQKWNQYFVIGFVIAISGIAMICFSDEPLAEFHWLGQLISIGACFVWAAYGLFSEGINKQNFDVILVTRRLFFYGLVFVVPLYLAKGRWESIFYLKNPVYAGNILYLGVCACALSFITWNFAISILGTVMTNIYVYLLPVVTIVMSTLILKEKITLPIIIGTVLTLIGLALSERK